MVSALNAQIDFLFRFSLYRCTTTWHFFYYFFSFVFVGTLMEIMHDENANRMRIFRTSATQKIERKTKTLLFPNNSIQNACTGWTKRNLHYFSFCIVVAVVFSRLNFHWLHFTSIIVYEPNECFFFLSFRFAEHCERQHHVPIHIWQKLVSPAQHNAYAANIQWWRRPK